MTYRLPHLASLQDIIEWADRIVSRSDLPNVARRLVRQTNDSIIKLDMGGDEEVTFGGYDERCWPEGGRPSCPKAPACGSSARLPTSVQRRTGTIRNERPRRLMWCPRRQRSFSSRLGAGWTRDKWAAEKKADGVWKDVVVFDAADIYGAMESAPAVHIQFSEAVGKPANSVGGLEDWWNRYRAPVGGLLTPELVLAGRDNEAAALLRTLRDQETGHTWIAAASIDDVLAFVASTLLTAPPEAGSDLLDRSAHCPRAGSASLLGHHVEVAHPASVRAIPSSRSRPCYVASCDPPCADRCDSADLPA